jgi:hypothetical protein
LQKQCPFIGKYVRPNGRLLLAYPALFFREDSSSAESKALRDFGLAQGWDEHRLPTPPDMRLEVTGGAGTETDSLPYLAKMSDLPALFDFKHNKPADLWAGRTGIQLGLEYRLYRRLG